ncbi:hypothetical protein [uncultured Sphingomonas sp.]|uniref:hypothetical protein n=1 Tax=uncultured Sphingomonas sp. TaxID=158754 RepID=UPI002638162E|nr:hypothetical protein [uncultured Sphingomonas sp.]
MKLPRIIAASGLVIASLGVSATADARGPRGDRHHDRGPGPDHRPGRGPEHRDYRGHHRGPDARYHRDYGRHDRNYRGDHRRYGYNGYGNSRCRVVWRNHRQVRVCR